MRFLTRDATLARVIAIWSYICLCVSSRVFSMQVSLHLCYTVFQGNVGISRNEVNPSKILSKTLDLCDMLYTKTQAASLQLTVCFSEICISPKLKIVLSEILSKTLDFEKLSTAYRPLFVKRDINKWRRPICCWLHLQATTTVNSWWSHSTSCSSVYSAMVGRLGVRQHRAVHRRQLIFVADDV